MAGLFFLLTFTHPDYKFVLTGVLIMISYRINYEKAIEAIIWLSNKKPNIDIYHVAKVLFYADKSHLNKYARPILGDTYIRMDYGPVPSGVRDLITENMWLAPEHLSNISESLEIDKAKHYQIRPKRLPNMDFFSKTDIECLGESLSRYGSMSFDQLKRLTHNERCWLEVENNQNIDYTLLIDEDNPDYSEIIEDLNQTARYALV